MISLPGKLLIKIINGRNGAFRVGVLRTEVGEFAVKDKMLDQYEEGTYDGVFSIYRIFASSYQASNRLVVEVRALLEDIALTNVDTQSQVEPEPIEQDPLEEEERQTSPLPQEKPDQHSADDPTPAEKDQDHAMAGEHQNPDAELFGLLWPLGDSVKLDATVDRIRFRRQRDRLKALNYRFNPVGQTWFKK
jgi:Protein of unknown function (DUF3275)